MCKSMSFPKFFRPEQKHCGMPAPRCLPATRNQSTQSNTAVMNGNGIINQSNESSQRSSGSLFAPFCFPSFGGSSSTQSNTAVMNGSGIINQRNSSSIW
jgi:hypothetical protein